MTKVILVRHGQTKWNLQGRYQGQTDVELSDEGIRQAQLVAARLREEKINLVYASDLERAYQTAQCIAAQHSLTSVKDSHFREISFGLWEGLTYEEIAAKWPQELSLFFSLTNQVEIPGGENIAALAKRVSAGIDAIVAQNPGKTVAIVSHGMAIRAAIAHYLHLPLDYVWSLRQDNTAVNKIAFYDGKAVLELVNDTHHLSCLYNEIRLS